MKHKTKEQLIEEIDQLKIKNTELEEILTKQKQSKKILQKSETLKHVNEGYQTYYNKKGEPVRSIGTVQDITDRTKAEEALKERENNFQQIIDLVPHFIFAKDEEGKYLIANKAVANVYGTTIENLIGKSDIDFSSNKEETAQFIKDDLEVIKSCKQKFIPEEQITNSDGNIVFLQTTKIPFKTFLSKKPAILGFAMDITERKQSEEKLIESEKQYRTLFHSANDAIFLMKGPLFIDCNNKALILFKAKRNEIIGHTPFGLSPHIQPDGKTSEEKAKVRINAALKGNPQFFEWQHKKIDGTIFYAEVSLNRLELSDGLYILAISRDITKRKKAENELKTTKEFAENLLETANSIIISLDAKANINIFNKYAEKITGYTKDEVIGKNWFETFIPKRYKKTIPILFNIVLKSMPKASQNENPILTKNGDEIIISWSNSITYDSSGNTNGVLGIGVDITEQKKIQNSLIESERNYRSLTESMTDVVVRISPTGKILYLSPSAKDFGGYTPEEEIGNHISKYILKKADKLRALKSIAEVMLTHKSGTFEFVIKPKNRTPFPVELTFRPVIKSGKVHEIQLVLRDISERKKNELLLQNSKNELQQINTQLKELVNKEVAISRKKDSIMMIQSKQAAMGEMIGSIAHQWRQPLNDIGLYIQNLQDSYDFNELTSESLNSTVEKTLTKLEYMSQTIDDFRNFFRSDKEKICFSLSNNIKKTMLLTEASFKNNSIEIILNIHKDLKYMGYPNEFSQAIVNILNNAKDVLTKQKTKNPHVHIDLSKTDKKIILTISNNGGKIPENIIDKIFDPYFTTKPNQTGTGLGLYISKTIIERNMSGKLTANSNNNNTEFRIELYE